MLPVDAFTAREEANRVPTTSIDTKKIRSAQYKGYLTTTHPSIGEQFLSGLFVSEGFSWDSTPKTE